MKARGDQVSLEKFQRWVEDDKSALKDKEKGLNLDCSKQREYKFLWKTFDKEVSVLSF